MVRLISHAKSAIFGQMGSLQSLISPFCSSQLIWEKLYNTKSSRDIGTLFYFRQKFGRTKFNVPAQVKKKLQWWRGPHPASNIHTFVKPS